MSYTNYQNVAISIDGSRRYASSASISGEVSFSPVKAVGIKGSAGMVMDGPPMSNVSIDLIGGGGGQPSLDLSGLPTMAISIGDAGGDFHPTGITASLSPNSVATGSFQGTMFGTANMTSGGGAGGQDGAAKGALFPGGHGGAKSSTGLTSAEYSFSASYDAIYHIGSMCPAEKFATDGQEEISVDGGDVGASVSCDDPCPSQTTLSFNIGALCGGVVESYSVTGFSTGGSLSVSEGGVLSGANTVVAFLI